MATAAELLEGLLDSMGNPVEDDNQRDWCAICKGLDDMPSPQRNDSEDRFVNNLVKELSKDNG